MLASLREFQVRPPLFRPGTVNPEPPSIVSSPPQRSGPEADPAQLEVLVLQASLELQAGQRAQRQAARAQENQNRALERLERDLQEALQQRREAERHNQVRKRGRGSDLRRRFWCRRTRLFILSV